MDVSLFDSSSPGEPVPIAGGNSAVVPDALPPNWRFEDDLWPLLVEAKQQLGILEGIGRNLQNVGIFPAVPSFVFVQDADHFNIVSEQTETTQQIRWEHFVGQKPGYRCVGHSSVFSMICFSISSSWVCT